ncbi:PAS domain-containing sensor histidine kinase [Zobellia barbeyronii]|uniref:histidine kinase n=1 Tax=Zobellia barbeyronii TaxID=2748009 RepID=A0ABS5WGU2_9FLAO|nr:PAS domain S-box protein [Zobellia barbeyronii]MBT2161422.1 PAS domain S-box protein [Zobellia barbeyronii]
MEKTTKKSKSKIPYHKIFIEQAPTAIAMFDKNMCYIAASNCWIKDYKLQGIEIIGHSHYDIFPEITQGSKELHQECIDKGIDVFDEIPFTYKDGTVKLLSWNIHAWYVGKNEIGGLFIHTIDITPNKEYELKKARTKEIFEQTKETAKIGTWEENLSTQKVYWSTMVKKIYEVSDNYIPTLTNTLNFYETDQSLPQVSFIINEALHKGSSFDYEAEIITAKHNRKWIRVVGKPEIIDGKVTRIFGIIQDISAAKSARTQLSQAHAQLKAIYNSESISIFSTDSTGVINHFNKGAELLLGYSASEMEHKESPMTFLPMDEVNKFRRDIALQYGKNPDNFSHYKDLPVENVNDTREWTYIRKDGLTVPVQCTVSSVKDDLGKNIGFIVVSTDISDLKAYQNEILAKNQLLNFAEQMTMIGHWQWNLASESVKWSKNLYTIAEVDTSVQPVFDTFFSLVHPEDQPLIAEVVDDAMRDKKFESVTIRLITTTGKTRMVHIAGVAVTNNQGEVVELMGTAQDVTELKMVEKKLKGLLESAPDAIMIINEQGTIQIINKQTETLFQCSPEELLKEFIEDFIPNILPFIKAAKFSNSNNTRQIGVVEELIGLRKNGEEVPISINMGPVEWEGELVISLAIRDITKQKSAERKIIKAKENLEVLAHKLTEQNRQLADFTHITSHNLRSPVSNLNSLLDIYKTTDDEVLKESLFGKFETVINQLTLTLNTLIEALKTKGPHTDEDVEEIEFEEVLSITKDLLAGEILKSGASITSDFSKCSKIKYHKIYLESIFLNLISNSMKYRSKSRKPEIEIKATDLNGNIKLEFRDNGLGIDLEQHGHKLFGLNKVFHRHPDAKGVGLFLTKSQIESMGGTISASSKVDVGTTFTINFN